MELYKYKCSRCGKSFIAASPEEGKMLKCVQCGSLKTYRLASQFGAIETLDEREEEQSSKNHKPTE